VLLESLAPFSDVFLHLLSLDLTFAAQLIVVVQVCSLDFLDPSVAMLHVVHKNQT
jgi:hypothetical protein